MIVVLAAWGNQRLDHEARSMVLVDATTGVEVEPVVVDRTTGRRVDGADFVFTAGPAASQAYAIATRTGRGCSRRRGNGRFAGGGSRGAHPTRRCAASRTVASRTTARSSRVRRRVVGRVLHDVGDAVPWHRVVRADGSLPMGASNVDVSWSRGAHEGGSRRHDCLSGEAISDAGARRPGTRGRATGGR